MRLHYFIVMYITYFSNKKYVRCNYVFKNVHICYIYACMYIHVIWKLNLNLFFDYQHIVQRKQRKRIYLHGCNFI